MKHVERKIFVDFEKEEKYLNEMAAKGLALTHYSWCKYDFEETPKGEYIYRIELLEKPINHPESQNYISFMEETGSEFVTSWLERWVYFRRKATDGEFDIYSDIDSKLKHYKRIRRLFSVLILLNLFIGLYNWLLGSSQSSMGLPAISAIFAIISFAVVALLLIFLVIPLTNKIATLEKEKIIRE